MRDIALVRGQVRTCDARSKLENDSRVDDLESLAAVEPGAEPSAEVERYLEIEDARLRELAEKAIAPSTRRAATTRRIGIRFAFQAVECVAERT